MPFASVLDQYQEYNEYIRCLSSGITPVSMLTGAQPQKAHLIYSACQRMGTGALVVVPSDLEAQGLAQDLQFFAGDDVLYFPSKEYVFYDVDTVSREMMAKRIGVIAQLAKGDRPYIVVAGIDAVLQYSADRDRFVASTLTLTLGEQIDIKQLAEKLVDMGYTREDMVEGQGQFSMRGGIVDIFPADRAEPVRIEFFDDEVDSIRTFDVSSQLSVDKQETVTITPCRELLFTKKQREQAVSALTEELKRLHRKKNDLSLAISQLQADIERFGETAYFASMDKYVHLLCGRIPTLLDFFASDTLYFIDEPRRVSERARSFAMDLAEIVTELLEKGVLYSGKQIFFYDYKEFVRRVCATQLTLMSTLNASSADYRAKQALSLTVKSLHTFHGKIEFLYDDLREWHMQKNAVVVLAGSAGRAQRLASSLTAADIECIYSEEPKAAEGQTVITTGSLSAGFSYPLIGFVLVSDREVFRPSRRRRASKMDDANRLHSFTDISPGDYVVHQTHGIGRYEGISKLTVDGVVKDYLKIAYQGTDSLYVPTDQLNLLYKYIGATDRHVHVNKLGGADWNKTKARVKASTTELAQQLIRLYAARMQETGYAFSPDTPWQREFEDTFAYTETDDQLRCIEEVKADMEATRPMDRLLCGDVGYGKTEVALRAAFKAVMDSKQVAYLVPTTILAMQHYNTFVQRMKDFPVRVEMMSRFRTAAQQRETLKHLKSGETDIVIGTHRILQKDLEFRDLGLLIVDEEQRFGVAHKEKLKEIRKNVDVLTMTATPIPRTLHMAMVNIRDMSVINQPPENRYPVQTYVMEYNESVIADAIRKELGRGGQVYYLHNRVNGIFSAARRVEALVPEARVGVGHGQMKEEELEDVMLDMVEGEINVLVCTTIIETGLDIPNVNTIIIENADKMGLAQLYQLRGRVGRSNRMAYAYLTYRRDRVLSDVAQKRLSAVREFTEFGSGFKIALRDLEIRGAGNLLGAAQHGHMDAVGYDMYCKILKESVNELQGVATEEKKAATVELSLDAHIPEDFIKSQDQRIDIYKKIAAIESMEDSYEVEEEIVDRFGDLPQSVQNVIDIARIKAEATSLGITEITQKADGVLLVFDEKRLDMQMILSVAAQQPKELMFSAGERPYLTLRTKHVHEKSQLLANIKFVLQRMKELRSVQ